MVALLRVVKPLVADANRFGKKFKITIETEEE